jgi:hypothetical protein
MIDFMYTGNYDVAQPQPEAKPEEQCDETEEAEDDSEDVAQLETTGQDDGEVDTSQELLVHTAVYIIAEEKVIPALKQLATDKFEQALPTGWNSTEFCTSLRKIYDETPENDHLLWDVAIQWAGKKAKELMDRGEFVELWKEKGEIGLGVFRAFLSSQTSQLLVQTTFLFGASPLFGSGLGSAQPQPKKVGCPDKGLAHSKAVVKGRRTNYYCHVCKKAFD